MPLIPDIDIEVGVDSPPMTSKTYHIDWETGKMYGMIEELDSVKQFIQKALSTERNKYGIYTEAFGVEFSQLRESNLPDSVLLIEVPRLITEAIQYDDRIIQVGNFKINFNNTTMDIYFEVASIYGDITIYENIGI